MNRIPFLLLVFTNLVPLSAGLVPALTDYDGTSHAGLPARLSQTGLYDAAPSPRRAVTSGIVAFEVNTPLWSDGSRKERYITLPAGSRVVPQGADGFAFPDRTVLVKNFSLDSIHGDSASRFLVETRFLIVRQTPFGSRYLGLTYKWRRDQSDAELVDPDLGLDTVHAVRWNGTRRGKRWRYPSQGDCTACHFNRGVLGFLAPQLNRPSRSNPASNQLQTLVTQGILSANPLAGRADPGFRWVGLSETGVTPPAGMTLLEWKARSYLAANCSQCHGNGHAHTFESASHDFDFFRAGRPIAYTVPDTVGGYVGKPSPVDPRFPQLIHRGYPESSLVLARLLSRPTASNPLSLQMPPLATYQMDSAAALVLKDWICGMGKRGSACRLPALQADSTYWGPVSAGPPVAADSRPVYRLWLREGSPLYVRPGLRSGAPFRFDLQGRSRPHVPGHPLP